MKPGQTPKNLKNELNSHKLFKYSSSLYDILPIFRIDGSELALFVKPHPCNIFQTELSLELIATVMFSNCFTISDAFDFVARQRGSQHGQISFATLTRKCSNQVTFHAFGIGYPDNLKT